MADISAFPTLPAVHDSEMLSDAGGILTFTASGTIKVGQGVCYAASGASMTVLASVAGEGTGPIGVALDNVTDGEVVAVAMPGCVVEMANADDTTAIDARDWVELNDNAVAGTINTVDLTASGTTTTAHPHVIGIALEDIPGGASGWVLIMPIPLTQGNAS